MAPVISVPADLAERFPDLVAALQPREFRGVVRVVGPVMSDGEIDDLLASASITPHRQSGFMLPSADGAPVETVRSDYKRRTDAIAPPWVSVAMAAYRVAGLNALDRVLIGTYGEGDHFGWHRDDMLPGTERRDLAVVIALNDDYEGGHLELPEAGLTLRLPKGAGVSFPASALHRVTPVTRSVRKVLLTFTLKD